MIQFVCKLHQLVWQKYILKYKIPGYGQPIQHDPTVILVAWIPFHPMHSSSI